MTDPSSEIVSFVDSVSKAGKTETYFDLTLRHGDPDVTKRTALRWPPDPASVGEMIWLATFTEIVTADAGAMNKDIGDDWRDVLHHWIINMQVNTLTGIAPVIMLTEAQQEALWFSEMPELDTDEHSFTGGVFVLLARPLRLFKSSLGDVIGLYSPSPRESNVALLIRHGGGTACTFSGCDLTEFRNEALAGDPAASTLLPPGAWTMMLNARHAAYLFGLQNDPPPALRPDRAERRRRERAAQRRPHEQQFHVRYLRDHGTVRVEHDSRAETGRHVRPHLRKGHVRWVRTGSMNLAKEERPQVRRYVPPVIVNGHLGLPEDLVIYRDQLTRSHSSMS